VRTSGILQYLDSLLQEQLIGQGQVQQLTVQQKELQTTLVREKHEINQLKDRFEVITQQLGQLDVDQLTTLQQKIQEIDTQVDLLWQQVPVERAQQN
jgi:archaellum component FlaC